MHDSKDRTCSPYRAKMVQSGFTMNAFRIHLQGSLESSILEITCRCHPSDTRRPEQEVVRRHLLPRVGYTLLDMPSDSTELWKQVCQ
jgi:hypothetical protein